MKQKRTSVDASRNKGKKRLSDDPIKVDIYPVIDNDLARDNLEIDLPAADLSELRS